MLLNAFLMLWSSYFIMFIFFFFFCSLISLLILNNSNLGYGGIMVGFGESFLSVNVLIFTLSSLRLFIGCIIVVMFIIMGSFVFFI